MPAIRIRKKIDSETLHLPELRPLIGKTVEIVVQEDEEEDQELDQKLAEASLTSAELQQLAAKHPPPAEWFEGEEENPLN